MPTRAAMVRREAMRDATVRGNATAEDECMSGTLRDSRGAGNGTFVPHTLVLVQGELDCSESSGRAPVNWRSKFLVGGWILQSCGIDKLRPPGCIVFPS